MKRSGFTSKAWSRSGWGGSQGLWLPGAGGSTAQGECPLPQEEQMTRGFSSFQQLARSRLYSQLSFKSLFPEACCSMLVNTLVSNASNVKYTLT